MLKKISSLFRGGRSEEKSLVTKDIDIYFTKELEVCALIPSDKYSVVLKNLLHENKLDTLSIQKEFDVLQDEAREIETHITKIYNRCTAIKAWDENLIKAINAGIKKFTLCSAGTGEDCDWCKSILGKEQELNAGVKILFEENCQCEPYRKSFIQLKAEF